MLAELGLAALSGAASLVGREAFSRLCGWLRKMTRRDGVATNWRQLAMRVGDARTQMRLAEGDPELEALAEARYRQSLADVRRAADEGLAELDRPAPPEPTPPTTEGKAFGCLPESWRSGA